MLRFSTTVALLFGAVVAGAASTTSAAVVVAGDNQVGAGGTTNFTPTYVVSSTDLLTGRTPTVIAPSAAAFALETSGGTPVLNDGAYGSINSGATGSHPTFATAGNTGGTSVTYSLAAASTINSIVIFGGWNDNGRDQQNYSISIATTGNPTLTPLSLAGAVTSGGVTVTGNTVDFNPTIAAGVQDATRTTISNNTGPLATNVTSIQFNFGTVENGYTGYAELDVIGVPEPGSVAMLGVGALGLLARRRRTA